MSFVTVSVTVQPYRGLSAANRNRPIIFWKALLQRLGISEDRCQILMGAQEFEIAELQREIVADNVRKDFSSALKKIRADWKNFPSLRKIHFCSSLS